MDKVRYLTIVVVSLFLFGVVVPPSFVSAESIDASANATIVPSEVTIAKASITSKDGHALRISVDLSNGVGIQPHVRYILRMVSVASTTGTSTDIESMFLEDDSMNEHTRLHQDLTYIAPRALLGTYRVYLQVVNFSAAPFAQANLGSVSFTPATSGVGFAPKSCRVAVHDALGSSTLLALSDTIAPKSTQSMTLACDMINYAEATTSFALQYETFLGSLYGKVVSQGGGDTQTQVLGPHEQRAFSLRLPQEANSSLYDILVSLVASGVTEDRMEVHYFVRGADAAVKNISLDKDYYAKGSVAHVGFVWTPAVVGYDDASVVRTAPVEVTLQDSDGHMCADTRQKDIVSVMPASVDVPILQTCVNPHVQIYVHGADDVTTASGELSTTSSRVPRSGSYLVLGVVLAALLTGGVLVSYIVLRRRRTKDVADSAPPAYPPPAAQ